MQKEYFDGKLQLSREVGWDQLRTIFVNPGKILILTHKNPDGDAIGSALGLRWILQNLGHNVNVVIPDDSPVFLKWLPGHNDIAVHNRKKSGKLIKRLFMECELIICADFNVPDRLGLLESQFISSNKPALLIDHHPFMGDFTKLQLVDSSLGSTSELIFLLFQRLQLIEYVGTEAATCLLAGILTDTVGLQVSSSYPEIFEIVAGLLRLGADKDRIYREVYNMFSVNRMRLLGYSLHKNMKLIPDLRTSYIALTKTELNSFHQKKGDTEGFVNYPLSIAGIVFSVLFTEQDDHIKLSLRSRGKFPANEFAQKYFNGGGHMNAAGGRFSGTLKEAVERFETVLNDYRELLLDDLQPFRQP